MVLSPRALPNETGSLPYGAIHRSSRRFPATPASPKPDAGHGAGDSGNGHAKASFWSLALGALGVVYGDIGTSPLYALKETVAVATGTGGGGHGRARQWRRVQCASFAGTDFRRAVADPVVTDLVVTVKYVFIILRADNNGEGGTLTLVALAQRALGGRNYLILFLGMAGAALFYGDAVITPAISVLSAVEGLKTVVPGLEQSHIMASPS